MRGHSVLIGAEVATIHFPVALRFHAAFRMARCRAPTESAPAVAAVKSPVRKRLSAGGNRGFEPSVPLCSGQWFSHELSGPPPSQERSGPNPSRSAGEL